MESAFNLTASCADLDARDGVSWRKGESCLDDWYEEVRQTPLLQLSDADIARCIRQKIHLNEIVPLALQRLESEPLAGDLYDGEMFVAFRSVPATFWSSNMSLLVRLKSAVEKVAELEHDEELRDDFTAIKSMAFSLSDSSL